jgi:hypothetical protein
VAVSGHGLGQGSPQRVTAVVGELYAVWVPEISMREFCRQRRLKETQFYWWRRMLKSGGQERRVERPVERERGSVALVSEEAGAMTADLELVLRDGRRLRIGRGIEEESLRAVLAALEPAGPRYRRMSQATVHRYTLIAAGKLSIYFSLI